MTNWLKELDALPKKYKKSKVLTYTTDKTDEIPKSFIGNRFEVPVLNDPTSSPTTKISPKEEANIRAWLAKIGETDNKLIAEVIDSCHTSPEARQYFLMRSRAVSAT